MMTSVMLLTCFVIIGPGCQSSPDPAPWKRPSPERPRKRLDHTGHRDNHNNDNINDNDHNNNDNTDNNDNNDNKLK